VARVRFLAGVTLLAHAACAMPGSPSCEPLAAPVALPPALDEASGVAVSRAHPGVFWVHGDGREPLLFAVDASGTRVGRFSLAADAFIDWEDMEIAACHSIDCLYLADTGDNEEERPDLRILRLPEPDPRGGASTTEVEELRVRLPDGGRDVEAIFVLPGERLHLVTKGRNHPVTIYRNAGPLRVDSVVLLEEVQRLGDAPRALPRQVTGASASPDGTRVAIRTYETVTFYAVDGDTLALDGETLNLRTLREPQGEGVGLGDEGLVALVSEAGPIGSRGSLALVRCEL
jgi:hypothetical protein